MVFKDFWDEDLARVPMFLKFRCVVPVLLSHGRLGKEGLAKKFEILWMVIL